MAIRQSFFEASVLGHFDRTGSMNNRWCENLSKLRIRKGKRTRYRKYGNIYTRKRAESRFRWELEKGLVELLFE
jgi:hypothetical protein